MMIEDRFVQNSQTYGSFYQFWEDYPKERIMGFFRHEKFRVINVSDFVNQNVKIQVSIDFSFVITKTKLDLFSFIGRKSELMLKILLD